LSRANINAHSTRTVCCDILRKEIQSHWNFIANRINSKNEHSKPNIWLQNLATFDFKTRKLFHNCNRFSKCRWIWSTRTLRTKNTYFTNIILLSTNCKKYVRESNLSNTLILTSTHEIQHSSIRFVLHATKDKY
jgi:ssDNA-binding Zn-finger/Zn-ribbon topoisomerase 1